MRAEAFTNWFFRPVGCPKPAGGIDHKKYVKNWMNTEGKDKNVFQQISFGTYLGGIGSILGGVGFLKSYFSDSKLGKWFFGILGSVGLISSAMGEFFGHKNNLFNTLHNKLLLDPNGQKVKEEPEERKPSKPKPEDLKKEILRKRIEEEYDPVEIDSKEGKLKGCFIKSEQETQNTILFLHGRGQDITDALEPCEKLSKEINANVLLVNYRQFGESVGEASVDALVEDAEKMYEYLTESKKIKNENIMVYGYSLGGGVATQLAHRLKGKGIIIPKLILQSTFTKPADVANGHVDKAGNFIREHIPFFKDLVTDFIPIKWVDKAIDKWVEKLVGPDLLNTEETLKKLAPETEVVIIHGNKDKIIPVEQSKRNETAAIARFKDGEDLRGRIIRVELDGCDHKKFGDYIASNEGFKAAIQFNNIINNSRLQQDQLVPT